MSAKTVLGAVLVGAWLTCVAAHGQEPYGPPAGAPAATEIPVEPTDTSPPSGPSATFGQPGPAAAHGPAGPGAPPAAMGPPGYACGGVLPTTTGLSDWILYRRDNGCTCSTGGPPMMVEIFMRSGVSTGVGGKKLEQEMTTGWRIEGGGRSLWFDPGFKKAWTIEANIVNTYNGARGKEQVPLNIFVTDESQQNATSKFVNFGQRGIPGVTIRGMNRTMVGLGIGREWYIWGRAANDAGPRWRIGWDGGGRYGTMKMDFNEIKHRTRVLENGYVAGHTDYEWNCGKCIYFAGFRCEWDYTANTILQTQSDFQDLNWLINLGVRW